MAATEGKNDSLSSESNQQPGNSQQVRFIPPKKKREKGKNKIISLI